MGISVLGPLEVRGEDGAVVDGIAGRQGRLVAAFALHAGSVVSAERLVHMVWDDDELPKNGVGALRTWLTRLRPALAAAGAEVTTHGAGYRLDTEAPLDAMVFADHVDAARRALDDGDAAGAVGLLDAALALWRGRPYEEVADLEWAQAEVARLTELREVALELRFDALLDRGRHTEIVGPLNEAIAASPWRDRLRTQLVLALYRSGRQADALRAIAEYRSDLAEELGLDPSAEIRQLEDQVLRQDPSLLPSSHRSRSLRGYRLEEVIGEGAFAIVWRGTQPTLARDVAVKQIRATLADQADFIRRFEAEAQLVASLEHPHIVPLHDYWREPGAAYLVMRLMRGGSLADRLLDDTLAEADLVRMVEQIGAALRASHRAGVIHRDLKAANVLLDEEDNFYLGDFGIALAPDDDDDVAAQLSGGSPAYASPEQLRRLAVDERTDVYSFGITLFEAATGQLPFSDARTRAALVRQQLEAPVPAPSTVAAVPRWLDDVVARATVKNPAERFSTVDDLISAVIGGNGTPGIGTWKPAIATPTPRNPYKALRAFGEADAADFHGRRRLVDKMLGVLRHDGSAGRFLAVVGPSGSGKSSAVRAGLVPALRNGVLGGSDRWFLTTVTPGGHPFEEIEAALGRIAGTPPGPLVEMMANDRRGIARAVSSVLPDAEGELVLVVDQFEELFTLTVSDEDRQAFLAGLVAAVADPRSRLRVVVTIRADFWDRPLRHAELAPLLEAGAVTITPLAADELESAIVGPAAGQGAEFEPGLVARIAADVADQPGALPLLQYTLTELFDRQVSGLILSSSYDELGGLTGALASTAEAIHRELDDSGRAAARRLFGRLVTIGDGVEHTRRRVLLTELGSDAAVRACVDAFGDARLLTFDRDPVTREPTVEIAHEALIRAWPRFGEWIDADADRLRTHRHLTTAATEWDRRGRDRAELYRGARLLGATELLREHAEELNPTEVAFVTESLGTAEDDARRARRRTRVLQGLLAATGVLLVLAVVAGIVAFTQRDDARDASAAAEASRAAAETRRLAAEALTTVETDPQLALLMATEAHRRDPGPATLGTLQRVMNEMRPLLGYLGRSDREYLDVEWAGDAIVAVHTGGLEVYEGATFDLRHDVPIPSGVDGTIDVRFPRHRTLFDLSTDGGVAVTATGATVIVVDTADGSVRTIDHGVEVTEAAVDATGTTVAVGDFSGVVTLYAIATGADMLSIEAHTEPESVRRAALDVEVIDRWGAIGVLGLAFAPDGSLVTAEIPHVRVWDPTTGELRREWVSLFDATTLPEPEPFGMVVPEDIDISGGDSPTVYISATEGMASFDFATGEKRWDTLVPTDRADTLVQLAGADIMPDGRLAISLTDGRVRILDESAQPTIDIAALPVDLGAGVAISPDASTALVSGLGEIGVLALNGAAALATAIPSDPVFDFIGIDGAGSVVSQAITLGDSRSEIFGRSADGSFDRLAVPDHLESVTTEVQELGTGGPVYSTFTFTEDAFRWTLEDAPDGTETLLEGFNLAVAYAYSSDGRWHAGHRFGNTPAGLAVEFVVWDLATGEEVASLVLPNPPGAAEFARSLSFSADDSLLIGTGVTGNYRVWDTASWAETDLLEGMGSVAVASFSPDGRFLSTAALDGTITLRDAATGEPLRELVGANPPLDLSGHMDWSADGSLLVTRFDNAGRLWDTATGVPIGAAFPNDDIVIPGSSTGTVPQLATRDGDAVLVWNLDVAGWPEVACRAAGRDFTADEWERVGPADEPHRETCPRYGSS